MHAFSSKRWFEYRSPLRVVVQILQRSANGLRRKLQGKSQELLATKRLLAQRELELQQQQETIHALQQQVNRLEAEKSKAKVVLPPDPQLNGHSYGPRLISFSINLAQICGFRSAERVMKLMFDWLDVNQQVPDATSIRIWMQRYGIAELAEPIEPADDWIWIVDHSNQIGPEKVLQVLAIRASQLPPPGEAIKKEHVRVLAILPGETWKREDMAVVYTELAKQHGPPREILADSAVELQEGAEPLRKEHPNLAVLKDFKHKAANLLKASIGDDDRFGQFMAEAGKTRSAIQQTELAFLTPPTPKTKSRFMNLQAMLLWASMVLWLLQNPEAKARKWATPERFEQKLGWLRSYADDLAIWRECQDVISVSLTFINEQGLFRGTSKQLRAKITQNLKFRKSKDLARQLVRFVITAERQVKEGERLTLSTEILESSFAVYKQLERQHSKGGFTSLIAAFPALLKPTTAESVKRAFERVHVKDVKQWVKEHLPDTLMSKRVAAYREARHANRNETILATTT